MASGNSLTGLVQHLRRSCGDGPSDGELLAEFAANRDESAFAELVGRHGRLVFGVARRHVPDRQAAEDVVQATFLALARNASCLGRPPSLVNWLYTVALRQARKARLRFARRAALLNRLPPPMNPVDPLAEVSGRELVTIIDDELARLPEMYRLPILLCALEGLSREEAARRLGWPTGSVKGRLERGRELLRTRLAKRGLTVPAVLAGGLLSTPSEVMPATLVAAVTRAAVTRAAVTLLLGGANKLLLIAGLVLMAAGVGAGVALTPGDQPGPKPGVQVPMAVAPQPRVDAEGVPLPPGVLARLGSSRMRQTAMIRAVALSPDGRTVASADWAGGLRLWDTATGRLLHRWDFRGAEDPLATLLGIGFEADGRQLHCAVFGKQVFLSSLDPATGHEVRRSELRGGKNPDCVMFANNGRLVASSWGDQVVRLYDTATGKETRKIPFAGRRVMGLAFSANDHILAVADLRDSLGLYDVATGQPMGELNQQGLSFNRVSLSADGRFAITMATLDRGVPEVQFWDLPGRKLLHRMGGPAIGYPIVVAFSRDNRLAITTSAGGPCIFWDATTGREVRRLDNFFGGIATASSADGRTLAVGSNSGTVTLWNTETGMPQPGSANPYVYVNQLRFNADGRQLIAVAGWPVAWDVETGRQLHRFADLAVSTSGLFLSPDARVLAVSREPAQLYDTATGRELRELRVEKTGSYAMAFTPDGRRLICGTTDAAVRVFDVATGENVSTLTGHAGEPDRFALSADGRWLATASSDDARNVEVFIRLWDLDSYREVRKFVPRGKLIPGMTFSNDGRRLAALSRPPTKDSSHNNLQVWEVATGREIRGGEINASYGDAVIAFAPDDRALAVGGGDGMVRLWEVATGSVRYAFAGHAGYIGSVAFSRDGHKLASSSLEAPVYLWDVYGRSDPQRPAAELARCWDDLASPDAAAAFRAVRRLINTPDLAASLLRDRLKPMPPVDIERIKQPIAQLDSPKFADRQAAAKELDAVADRAVDQLRAELVTAKSAEGRRSLQAILDRMDAATPEMLRAIRAVEVLGQIGTPAAREHLRALAGGAAGSTLTRAASEALTRLSK